MNGQIVEAEQRVELVAGGLLIDAGHWTTDRGRKVVVNRLKRSASRFGIEVKDESLVDRQEAVKHE